MRTCMQDAYKGRLAFDVSMRPLVISSAFGMGRGEVFYGPTDWLGSRDPMTHHDYAPDSSSGLMTDDWLTDTCIMLTVYDRRMTDDD
jgi:hypothetical protein